MINTKKRENLYLELSNKDLVGRIKKLLDSGGYMMRMEDGKFVPKIPQVGYDAPWVYVSHDTTLRCDLYHRVFFNIMGHIHSRCRECWKVVVRPQTLTQLFELYEFQREMGVPCKCGLELRKTVCGLYGGYFYCRGKEQGLERYKEVRALVDERLGPEVPVILKRYCTEFEIGEGSKGPSDQTPDATHEEIEFEMYVEAHFPRVVGGGVQMPDHLMASVMVRWIHHAFEHADMTYLEYTGGEKLTQDYVTYHNEEG